MKLMLFCLLILVPQEDQKPRPNKSLLSPGLISDYVDELSTVIENEELYKELEIVKSQAVRIKSRVLAQNKEYNKEIVSHLKVKDEKTRIGLFNQTMKNHAEKIKSILNDELLAHQVKKLDRVIYWSIVRSHRMTQLQPSQILKFHSRFEDEAIKRMLEIDQKQTKKIRQKVQGLQREFYADMAELYDKYEKRVASELGEEQRKLDKRLFGKTPSFIFKHVNN